MQGGSAEETANKPRANGEEAVETKRDRQNEDDNKLATLFGPEFDGGGTNGGGSGKLHR